MHGDTVSSDGEDQRGGCKEQDQESKSVRGFEMSMRSVQVDIPMKKLWF